MFFSVSPVESSDPLLTEEFLLLPPSVCSSIDFQIFTSVLFLLEITFHDDQGYSITQTEELPKLSS